MKCKLLLCDNIFTKFLLNIGHEKVNKQIICFIHSAILTLGQRYKKLNMVVCFGSQCHNHSFLCSILLRSKFDASCWPMYCKSLVDRNCVRVSICTWVSVPIKIVKSRFRFLEQMMHLFLCTLCNVIQSHPNNKNQ